MKRTRISTRLSIVTQSLADAKERLDALPETPEMGALRVRIWACEEAMFAWILSAPSEAERTELVSRVLALHLDVMNVGRTQRT